MTPVASARRTRAVVPLVAVLLTLGLAACSSTGVAGSPTVTAVDTPTVVPTLTDAEVAAIIKPHAALFVKAARAFRKCDRKISEDNYTRSPCLAKAAAETAAIDDLLADLSAVRVPASAQTKLADLKLMSAAGAAVAQKCAKANDQKCDQALARFRADEQSLIWDLGVDV